MSEPRKRLRAEFRKNRGQRRRRKDWSDAIAADEGDAVVSSQRVGKDELSRKRTVHGEVISDAAGEKIVLDVDPQTCLRGRVLSIHGIAHFVAAEDGVVYRSAVRRILKTLQGDQRHSVAVGDHVLLRPAPGADPPEAFIERVEPRHGCICREIRGRQQVLVANVDQVAVVASADEPPIKPNLIDRLLVSAEKGRVRPFVCINKIDLVDPVEYMPLVGVYARMGCEAIACSAATGAGLPRLRSLLTGCETVMVGQSGVGKSSLLNAIDPSLNLKTGEVVRDTLKGRHTTTAARLLPLSGGGFVVDTPGIRQFQLWDFVPMEVCALFRDLRPFVSLCRFPNCTHTHEQACAVKNAVADGRLDQRRYESYCHMIAEEEEPS